MNQNVIQYRKEVLHLLKCSTPWRKQLTKDVDNCLYSYLQDDPAPERKALDEAFGTPAFFAARLMEDIPAAEQEQYQKNAIKQKRLALSAAVILFVALLSFSIYAIWIKSNQTFVVYESLTVYAPDEESDVVVSAKIEDTP